MGLCRLGVRKLFLLDRDTYDATNLTRQILGGIADVGDRKVAVAMRNLPLHNLRSELVPMDMDAVLRWSDVVAAASQCTVVFNCIDYGTVCVFVLTHWSDVFTVLRAGGMFDYAVNSLCKRLRIPYITGSSYAWSMQCGTRKRSPHQVPGH